MTLPRRIGSLLTLALTLQARAATDGIARIRAQAPDLAPEVLDAALRSLDCAAREGLVSGPDAQRWLTIIDYSRPSTEKRLWVLDLSSGEVRFHERVAHGRNSGDNLAVSFSNQPGSLQSSLGVFRTAETYVGEHGTSLRLDGLEPGINDHARDRAIVMHGAPYVCDAVVGELGRLGRSQGCPALAPEVASDVIQTIEGGTLLVSWYPDSQWLSRSPFLHCSP